MRYSKRTWAAVGVVVALLAVACSKSSSGTTGSGGNGSGAQIKVGMALPGPKNDKGFNEGNYDGIPLAEQKYGIKGTVIDNVVDPQARIDALKNLAQDNDLVIGVGGEFAQAGVTVAPQFPNVQFAIINGQASDAKNLHIYFVRQGVPAYIAGVVAAHLTKAKKVGYLGGELIPPTTQSDDGFKAGVHSVDPSIAYSSTIVGNFNDPAKAKSAAEAQIASGVDVIFALIDAGFPGIEQAVQESGKDVLMINPILPRCTETDKLVGDAFLSSADFVAAIVKEYIDKSMPTQPKAFGVEDQAIQRFELCPAWKGNDDLQKLIDDTTAAINAGSVTLPQGV